jgi:hypothetical protein
MFFKKRSPRRKKMTQPDDKFSDKNKEAFRLGMSIAKLITYSWNSQEKPRKVYLFNRRVHHGGVGSLLGLSDLFKKFQPIPSGILSGLGEGLVKDDYADRDEWFKFKKKHDDTLVPESATTSSTETNVSHRDFNNNNTKTRHDDNNKGAIEGTQESSSKNQDEEKQ